MLRSIPRPPQLGAWIGSIAAHPPNRCPVGAACRIVALSSTSEVACDLLAVMCWPFMPGAAQRLRNMLGRGGEAIRWEAPAPAPVGQALGTPQILFAKLEPGALG